MLVVAIAVAVVVLLLAIVVLGVLAFFGVGSQR